MSHKTQKGRGRAGQLQGTERKTFAVADYSSTHSAPRQSFSSQLDQALTEREHYDALANYHSGQALICRFLALQAGLRLSRLQRQIPLFNGPGE